MLRVNSGIPGLDQVIGGGFPERSVTLVYGPPKSGKSMCAHQFMAKALSSGEACVYVTVDYTTDDLADYMSMIGEDISTGLRGGALRVLDASSHVATLMGASKGLLSWLKGPMPLLPSPQTPLQMAAAILPVMRSLLQSGSRFRSVVDSLTPLFVYNPPIISARFVRDYKAMIRQTACTAGLVTYSEGAMDNQTETILKASVDNIIHLLDGNLIIEGMIGTPKNIAKYHITARGIVLEAAS